MSVKVRDAIKHVQADGWQLVRTRGSDRQYRHPAKPGLVTIAGKPSDTLRPKTVGEHHRTGRTRSMSERRYLIVIERDLESNYSAYAPDLPGCVATGARLEECQREMRDAVGFHLEGLRDAGEVIPEPSEVTATFVSVAA